MKQRRRDVPRSAAILVVGLFLVFPLVYLVSGSLMTVAELAQYPPAIVPAELQWSNFTDALEVLDPRSILNSFIFVTGVIVVQLALSLPAGFALARIPFRFTALVAGLFLFPIIVPGTLTLIPTYVVTFALGLVGTYPGLILPVAAGASIGVLLFRQAFASLPDGLIDAARIDGASWLQTFWKIGLPLIRPAIAAYMVVTFLGAWNLYIWPAVVAPGKDTQPISVALLRLVANDYTFIPPTIAFAGAVISVIPVLIVFLLFQRWFTRGLVGTGLD